MNNYREKRQELILQAECLDAAKMNVKKYYEAVLDLLFEQKKYLDNLNYWGKSYNTELSRFCEEEYCECMYIERYIYDKYEGFCEEAKKEEICFDQRQSEMSREIQEEEKYVRNNQNQ